VAFRKFTLRAGDISYRASNLCRPECVVAESDGTLWVSDKRGGVTRIDRDGRQAILGGIPGLPNGITIAPDGSLLVAELECGGIYRLQRDGRTELLLDSVDGKPLGSTNFVHADAGGRIWATVSTRTKPRFQAVTTPIPDGFIVLIDNWNVRIVADGLHFAKEIRIDTGYRYLYVAETALGRISRFHLRDNGDLADRETFGPATLFKGALVDGIAFAAEGALWITEVSRNGIHRITPDGSSHCVFEDPGKKVLNFPASLAFAGPDLRTVYIGSTRMNQLASFVLPVAGCPLPHWRTPAAAGL
jgi:gluconolactonase